jgi:glycine hydroxymethyltransferase
MNNPATGFAVLMEDALKALAADELEAEDSIFLTAYENRPSRLVESVLSSPLSRRYHLGTSADRPPGDIVIRGGLIGRGFKSVQMLEQLAHVRTEAMFSATHSDFRLLSGLHATTCTLGVLTEPGDTVYSLSPHDGGHFATAPLVARLGRRSAFLPERSGWRSWDVQGVAAAFAEVPPAAILVDCGIQITHLDVRPLREIAGPKCVVLFDASHTLGLIGGGCFESPLLTGCDVLQGNTHKSFFGPHRAMVLFKEEEAGRRFSDTLGGAFVSSQLTSVALALYLAVLELAEFGRDYAEAVIQNANTLGHALAEHRWELACLPQARFTETNLLLVNRIGELGPYEAYQRLAAAGIITNARPFRGKPILRLGVQEVTRNGFDSSALLALAALMDRAVRDPHGSPDTKRRVQELSRSHNSIRYSFDETIRGRTRHN